MHYFRAAVLAVVISFALPISQLAAQEIAVIVNPANSTDSLDKSELARIFLGRANTFPGGERAVPVVAEEANSTRIAFEQAVLGKSASQMKAYWTKQMFSGQGRPPESLSGDADILSRVASDADAIGYIPVSMVDATVKVVFQQ